MQISRTNRTLITWSLILALTATSGNAQMLFSSDKRERGGRLVGADYILLTTPLAVSTEGIAVGRIRSVNFDERGKKSVSEVAFAAMCSGQKVGILFEEAEEIAPVDITISAPGMAGRQVYDLWWLVCRGKKNAF